MNAFDDFPSVVIWEMTRACRLACEHCRAISRRSPDPTELSADESLELIDHIAQAEPQLLIFTGGDPCRRKDLIDLITYASAKGLRVGLSPGATPDFLVLDIDRLREAGVSRVSLSLDGATEESHNSFRGVTKAWRWTMQAVEKLNAAGLPFQIHSTITSKTLGEFDALAKMVESLNPAGWTIFMVVPTGRADMAMLPQPAEVEQLFSKLVEISRRVPFAIRTTEGQHYRRVLAQNGTATGELPAAVNDAKGLLFISHTGEIYPSGFLPLSEGNVRNQNLLCTYRNAPLFQRLRDPQFLKGKCGRCSYNRLCGGSRARAYAVTGDPFAEEPLCIYQP